jgi:hypothetical protein
MQPLHLVRESDPAALGLFGDVFELAATHRLGPRNDATKDAASSRRPCTGPKGMMARFGVRYPSIKICHPILVRPEIASTPPERFGAGTAASETG